MQTEQFIELSSCGKTLVVICNPNLRGRCKWLYYDKDDPSHVSDPASKAETFKFANAVLREHELTLLSAKDNDSKSSGGNHVPH